MRRHHVRRLTRNTLRQLQSDASQKNAAEFYEGAVDLREQIGLAIDQPAAGLTANSCSPRGWISPRKRRPRWPVY